MRLRDPAALRQSVPSPPLLLPTQYYNAENRQGAKSAKFAKPTELSIVAPLGRQPVLTQGRIRLSHECPPADQP